MLFIISASIAIKKCNAILKALSNQQIFINCIVTNNAKKMTDLEDLKKSIKGKIYSDSSEKNNKMLGKILCDFPCIYLFPVFCFIMV